MEPTVSHVPRIIMFIPHLALRYAGMLLCKLSPVFGQPLAGTLFIGAWIFSVVVREDVPLAMNKSRGFGDFSRSGMKVAVMICVPAVLRFQDAFHASRIVISPL